MAFAADTSERRDEVDRHLGTVRRIGVFRALVLGDLLCATPALRLLRRRFPGARVTLIGLPWARDWVARQDAVDDFVAFPGHPGLPERGVDEAGWPGFLADLHAHRFDLLLQLHGSGGLTNSLTDTWGARHVAAFHEPGVPPPDPVLGALWPAQGTEVERMLSLVKGLGPPASAGQSDGHDDIHGLALEFPLTPQDEAEAAALLADAGLAGQPYVCVHAGAQLPSRRWPVDRFATVARALFDQGHAVVLTGVAGEKALVSTLKVAAGVPCVDLSGRTSLWSLGALIAGARLLVCNDTGVSHVAAALQTPSVVISSGADVARWAPHDAARHPVLWADRHCRPCAHAVCPHGHECALAVSADMVIQRAMAQLSACDRQGHPMAV